MFLLSAFNGEALLDDFARAVASGLAWASAARNTKFCDLYLEDLLGDNMVRVHRNTQHFDPLTERGDRSHNLRGRGKAQPNWRPELCFRAQAGLQQESFKVH